MGGLARFQKSKVSSSERPFSVKLALNKLWKFETIEAVFRWSLPQTTPTPVFHLDGNITQVDLAEVVVEAEIFPRILHCLHDVDELGSWKFAMCFSSTIHDKIRGVLSLKFFFGVQKKWVLNILLQIYSQFPWELEKITTLPFPPRVVRKNAATCVRCLAEDVGNMGTDVTGAQSPPTLP